MSVLLTVLLGIGASWREDLQTTSSKLVDETSYGRLVMVNTYACPENLSKKTSENIEPGVFIREIRGHFRQLRPAEVKRHGKIKPFIFKDLKTTDYVLLFREQKRNSLQMPYKGPYEVISREEKHFTIKIKEKEVTVSIDRLKSAYVITDTLPEDNNETPYQVVVQVPEQRQYPGEENQVQPPQEAEQPQVVQRSGQSVRFVDHYQAGFG